MSAAGSTSHSFIALALAGCAAATLPEPASSARFGAPVAEYDVLPFPGGELHVRLASDGHTVGEWIANTYAIPIAVHAVRRVTNLTATAGGRTEIVLAAKAEALCAVWDVRERGAAWHEHTDMRTELGDPNAHAAPYVYALPFALGDTHNVIQGFDDPFSHHGDDKYAVDFAMPEGSTVRAARDGTVVAFNDRATAAGTDKIFRERDHANWIAVLHADGTLGEYWHLQPGGVHVRVGQRVERGDALGLSGMTGFTTTPHLHFEIRTAVSGQHVRSFPFVFATHPGDKTGAAPQAGRSYTAFE